MNIYVEREKPKQPEPLPIIQVDITLDKEEAELLVVLFGKLSVAKVREIIGVLDYDNLADRIQRVTGAMYYALADEGLECLEDYLEDD